MPMSTWSLRLCSKGSSMPSPTEMPPTAPAPPLAASMMPGPPPVITAYPASASAEPLVGGRGRDGLAAERYRPLPPPTRHLVRSHVHTVTSPATRLPLVTDAPHMRSMLLLSTSVTSEP